MSEMTELYAWIEEDPREGEGVIAVFVPAIGRVASLHSRRLDIARSMRSLAQGHFEASGHPVRLVRFTRAEEVEALKLS